MMYKRQVFTTTWKSMEDLAFIDLHSQDRLEPEPMCARCGLSSAEWTAREGSGYLADGETFCCQGCAEGRACTCQDGSATQDAWDGVGSFTVDDHDEGDAEEAGEPPEPQPPEPFQRNAFTLTWHAPRQRSHPNPARRSTPSPRPRSKRRS
jgi:hypothetical protein